MTKFEELMDIISRKKNKGNTSVDIDNKEEKLEVAGSEGSKTPLLSCGGDDIDMDLVDQLYRKGKYRPNDGSGAASWDATWD
jgi:hypothetical protein